MLDLEGTALSVKEKELIGRSAVGGVILFGRNYESVGQVRCLTTSIRAVNPDLVIAVDQEGGRVQRFKAGLTRLPALKHLGDLYDLSSELGCHHAKDWGWLMAVEMIALGLDISFAPVLDLNFGSSEVIGDRAFHASPVAVAELAEAYISGMAEAGMASTGKHFPGHGAVAADSHTSMPVDRRSFQEIDKHDLNPFRALVSAGLGGIMPAHVIYENLDQNPAGFSRFWIQTVLREQLGFDGVVFSDDLTMEGASIAGDYPARARAALEAGCDMVLVCNNRNAAALVLDVLEQDFTSEQLADNQQRLQRMKARQSWCLDELKENTRWLSVHNQMNELTGTRPESVHEPRGAD